MSKPELRLKALRARRSLPPEKLEDLSRAVKNRLENLPSYAEAKVVASYVAKSDEVRTQGIIESALASGKRVMVPRTDPTTLRLSFAQIQSLSELSPGAFGIPEPGPGAKPETLSEADVVLVPIVAWDDGGHRLGYGRGYFDRELRSKGKAVSVGLALESQRFDSVPQTAEDVSLEVIVTEDRTLVFGGHRN